MSLALEQLVMTVADLKRDVQKLQQAEFPLGAVTINDSTTGWQLKLANGSGDATFSINSGGDTLTIEDIKYLLVKNDAVGGEAYVRFQNDAQTWEVGVNTTEDFRIKDITGGVVPFAIQDGAEADLLCLKSGYVGVGTTNPQTRLHIYHSTDDIYLRVETAKDGGVAAVAIRNDAQIWQFRVIYNDDVVIRDGINSKNPIIISPNTDNAAMSMAPGAVTWGEGYDHAFGTTTGSMIATGASQKIGFYGATPVNQRQKANYNNWGSLSDVVNALVALGLFDTA